MLCQHLPADRGEGQVDHHEEEEEGPQLRHVHVEGGLRDGDEGKADGLLTIIFRYYLQNNENIFSLP